jgi:hypothetical protein
MNVDRNVMASREQIGRKYVRHRQTSSVAWAW